MAARSFGVAAFAALLAIGCKGVDEDVEPIVAPKVVAFEGKIDPKYVGDWSSKGDARLNLKPDGSALVESTMNTPAGKSTSRFDGKWLSRDGHLLVQYGDATHSATTLEYVATLSGAKMILQQPGGRMKTTYLRK